MKQNICQFILSAFVMMITFAFTGPQVSSIPSVTEDNIISMPMGGAHLMFAGKNGGEITKKEIEGQSELKVDGCAAGAKILKYTLYINKSGKITSLFAETNYLNKDMQAALRSLSAGDSFEFKQVRARLLDNNDVVDVTSSRFVVVDKKA